MKERRQGIEKVIHGKGQMIRRYKRIWLWRNRVSFDVTAVRRIAMSAITFCLFHLVRHSKESTFLHFSHWLCTYFC